MGVHRIFFPDLPGQGREVRIDGEEAHHAVRVKRLAEGDIIGLLDGAGAVATARIGSIDKHRGEWSITALVENCERAERARPVVEVWASTPKGDRLETMIDGLSQVGAASWHALETERTVVEPRGGKIERLRRTCIESMKQCGRAWMLEIGPAGTLADALNAQGRAIIMADGGGQDWQSARATLGGMQSVRLLIGPEGGWTPEELQQARGKGAAVVRFGPHTMRIETAAIAACACIMTA